MKHTIFSRYLKAMIWLSSLSLVAIAIFNYVIDPALVYSTSLSATQGRNSLFNSDDDEIALRAYVSQLVGSDHGFFYENATWNTRDLKRELALLPTTAECAVIGSSHVMHISSFRQQKSITHNCPSIINLGVDGASLEDYVAWSEMILQNKRPPKSIVFGIAPWSLNVLRENRSGRYMDEFKSMQGKLMTDSAGFNQGIFYYTALLRNLINRDYLMRSIRFAQNSTWSNDNETRGEMYLIKRAPSFNYDIGPEKTVLLPDGSILYTKAQVTKMSSRIVSGIHNYKIYEGSYYEESAVSLFTRLVLYLQQQFKVIFLLTPYHPAVWSIEDQNTVTALKLVEQKVHQIAKSVGVLVIGSYNPRAIGCNADEFFDEMHPTATCLAKLETISSQY